MKNLKKILAVVLALSMVLATFSVFAEEAKEESADKKEDIFIYLYNTFFTFYYH